MRSATIAIVDDDSRVLESLENLLESAGYKVRPFGSSPAVLAEAALTQVDPSVTAWTSAGVSIGLLRKS